VRVPTLASGPVVLRPWEPQDAAWYVAARDDEVFAWTRESPSLTVEEAAAQFAATAGDPDRAAFAIVDPGGGELLGNVGLVRHPDAVELSIWVAAPARGRGVAGVAVAAAAYWAAGTCGRPRLELLTHPGNTASQRVAEKAGFTTTGLRASCDSCADERGMVLHFERPA
jgi:RimJ/RimL family protein N-acetyltransferase